MKKLIFDIGCNQGQNFEYFLKKSDYIIGIEANPKLCKEIRGNFSNEIKKEQLIIVNKIITNSNKTNQNFYISKKKMYCRNLVSLIKLMILIKLM